MPTFQPELWNDANGVQFNNNCYDYARDQRTGQFTQPGQNHEVVLEDRPFVCEAVAAAAGTEGVTPSSAEANCGVEEGCWKLALVIDPDPLASDYHWYRQDDDGTWSHKPGQTRARNVDNSGQPITDPEQADTGTYTQFCGYFCVCPVEVVGTMEPMEERMGGGGGEAPSVQVLLYAGRANPTVTLEEADVAEVHARIADLPSREPDGDGGLGYAGCVARVAAPDDPALPLEVRAFDGVVSINRGGRVEHFADERGLETWMLGRVRETEAWEQTSRRIAGTAEPGAAARAALEDA